MMHKIWAIVNEPLLVGSTVNDKSLIAYYPSVGFSIGHQVVKNRTKTVDVAASTLLLSVSVGFVISG